MTTEASPAAGNWSWLGVQAVERGAAGADLAAPTGPADTWWRPPYATAVAPMATATSAATTLDPPIRRTRARTRPDRTARWMSTFDAGTASSAAAMARSPSYTR